MWGLTYWIRPIFDACDYSPATVMCLISQLAVKRIAELADFPILIVAGRAFHRD